MSVPPHVARVAAAAAEAEGRIRPFVRETPLEHSLALSRRTGRHVDLKLEHLQHAGSFKVRGALAKLTKLDEEARQYVVTASTGNHGLAVLYATRCLGAPPPQVFVPVTADGEKVARLREHGATVVVDGETCAHAEAAAAAAARDSEAVYISPYNDDDVVAGQATLGRELLAQANDATAVYVAVGGGGLIGGVGAALKAAGSRARIVGCVPEHSPGMRDAVLAGHVVPSVELPTFSDATAGGVEEGSLTVPLCTDVVDEWITVSEPAIAEAFRALYEAERWFVEGAAAVPLAALMQSAPRTDERAIVVLCGRNVSVAKVEAMLDAGARAKS